MSVELLRAKEIFLAAVDLSEPTERSAYLDRACGTDAPLRGCVDTLLSNHAEAGAFLEKPAFATAHARESLQAFLDGDPGAGETVIANASVPAEFGPYRAVRVLGEGGMGRVFEAEDSQLRRPVALKVMRPDIGRNPGACERFLREARAAAAVRHERIVTIYQVGESNGLPYLVMELLEGQSLETRCRAAPSLPLAEVLRIGREVATGLAAAHATGLTHRDIKPDNIWLQGPAGQVKLLDFGLAGETAGAGHSDGLVGGTPAYMAPEQALGEPVDARADLYSLGCVLYRLAAGQLPFAEKSPGAIRRAQTSRPLVPLHQVAPHVPASLSRLVSRLLARRPEDRPPSAQAVAALLQSIEEECTTRTAFLWRRNAALACVVVAALTVPFFPALHHLFMPSQGRPSAKPAPADKAFLVLGQDGRPARAFADLTAALAEAQSGATIEVCGDGPFSCEPLQITDKSLTIRAAPGFRPILRRGDLAGATRGVFLETNTPLVLEGLELQDLGAPFRAGDHSWLVWTRAAPALRAAHCRFRVNGHAGAVNSWGTRLVQVQACEFYGGEWGALACTLPAAGRCEVDNCVMQTRTGLTLEYHSTLPSQSAVDLRHTTFVVDRVLELRLFGPPTLAAGGPRPTHIRAEANIFDGRECAVLCGLSPGVKHLPPDQVEALWPRILDWSETRTLYPPSVSFVKTQMDPQSTLRSGPIANLAGWQRYWGHTGTDLVQQTIVYAGGDLRQRPALGSGARAAGAFRLLEASFRDPVGAQVDRVGPGARTE